MDLKNIRAQHDETVESDCRNKTQRLKEAERVPFLLSFGGFSTFIFLAVNVTLVLVGTIILVSTTLVAKNGNLCLTEQCINTASSVLRAMDRSVDPCTDFYQYACGSWMKDNPVPDSTATWDRLAILRESLLLEMRQLLEAEPGHGITEPDALRKAKLLYRTCMNTDELERKGLDPIKRVLKAVGLSPNPPGFSTPTTELENKSNSTSSFDWLFTIARSRRLLGINILYGMNVAEDVRNSSLYKIVIEQTSPGFGEKFLLEPGKFSHEIRSFKHHIVKMLTTYTNSTAINAHNAWIKYAEDIIAVASKIAKVMTPVHKRRSTNHLFHEVTLEELDRGPGHETWKLVNWTRYLNIVFNDTSIKLAHKKDKALLLDLPYMEKVSLILDTLDRKQLERFVWWNVFSALAPLTISNFRTLGYDFAKQLLGLRARTPRWKGCTNNVNSNFGLALSYAYVRSRLRRTDKDNVLIMLNDVRNAFEEAVHKLDWMDDVTREKTLTKLYAIRAFVGYPGWILNTTQLNTFYEQAHVSDGNLFDTFLNLTNASITRNLEKMRKQPNRNRWVATATTVNAFYSATLNSVTFPAGILKPPFYGNGIEAIDYGAIGAIMGHEITHGFDDQGRRYDEHGNLKQWWSLETLEHYHDKVQCIIDQYNNYTMPELGSTFNVQGINTQGENIADNGGLRSAFVGYKRRQTMSGTMHQRLPGLPHITNEQLFFLGFAQIWCGNSTLGALKSKLVDGVHSPNRVRVIGTLSNSQEFATAWNCPSGTPMNPQHKCVLW